MKKLVLLFLVSACFMAMMLQAALPQAAVTSPNGGEILYKDGEYTITWNCSNCAGNVNVIVEIYNTEHSGPGYHGQISPGGVPMSQGFFKWLAVGKLKDGSYLNPDSGYKIHLEAVDGSDASDGTFSIRVMLRKIVITRLDLHRLPNCPECVRIDLKPLLENFKNCQDVYRISLFANDLPVADLGEFGGQKRMHDFIDARLGQPLQVQAQNRRGRFELRLFNRQGQLLQTQPVQLGL